MSLKMANKDPKIVTLIQAVRRNTVLYDFRQGKHYDARFKARIWEDIAEECGIKSAVLAKNIWRDLKKAFMICYRNKLIRLARANYDEKVVSLPPEQSSDAGVAWKYYSDMRFIAPFRIKGTDSEMERLIQLAKPIVMRMDTGKKPVAEDSAALKITTTSVSAETQTPAENVLMDIPPISEAEMSQRERCMRSFFDAMFRTTCSLPVHLQSKVKRDLLQSLNDAEILADAEKRLAES